MMDAATVTERGVGELCMVKVCCAMAGGMHCVGLNLLATCFSTMVAVMAVQSCCLYSLLIMGGGKRSATFALFSYVCCTV